MPRSRALAAADTMLTSDSDGRSTPARAAAVSGLVLSVATSPEYSRRMPLMLVSVSWPANSPSCSASFTQGRRRGASSAEMLGKLTALEIAPLSR